MLREEEAEVLNIALYPTLFLVGAFLVKRARLLQWLVFFLFLSDYTPHPDCSTFLTTETTKALGQVGPAET